MKYTDSHEWIKLDASLGTVGITRYAKDELGEIVYVQLPSVGQILKQGEEAVVLESTKAAADIYAPVSGEVIAVNEALQREINSSPEDAGWLFKIRLTHASEYDALLTEQQYHSLVQ